MEFKAICNLKKSTPSGAEDASYRLSRSHLNQKTDPGYKCGEIFQYVFQSESGVWLKDAKGISLFVPRGEMQCFEEIK